LGSKDVAEMLNTVVIHKQGHRKKLESSLQIRKSVLTTSKEAEKVHPQEKNQLGKKLSYVLPQRLNITY